MSKNIGNCFDADLQDFEAPANPSLYTRRKKRGQDRSEKDGPVLFCIPKKAETKAVQRIIKIRNRKILTKYYGRRNSCENIPNSDVNVLGFFPELFPAGKKTLNCAFYTGVIKNKPDS